MDSGSHETFRSLFSPQDVQGERRTLIDTTRKPSAKLRQGHSRGKGLCFFNSDLYE